MLTADLIFKLIRPTFGSILMSEKYKSWEISDHMKHLFINLKRRGIEESIAIKRIFFYKNVQVDFLEYHFLHLIFQLFKEDHPSSKASYSFINLLIYFTLQLGERRDRLTCCFTCTLLWFF